MKISKSLRVVQTAFLTGVAFILPTFMQSRGLHSIPKPQNTSINSKSPLILQHAQSLRASQNVDNQDQGFYASHTSHASHSSHRSHSSHSSHRSSSF